MLAPQQVAPDASPYGKRRLTEKRVARVRVLPDQWPVGEVRGSTSLANSTTAVVSSPKTRPKSAKNDLLECVHLQHQESRNALLERMPVFQNRRLTRLAMLIKPTFEHADAFIP